MSNGAFVREREPMIHEVMCMTVMYMAATQQWFDLPPRPCPGAVFVREIEAVKYATARNLQDLVHARAMLERFGVGVLEFPTSFDYHYIRSRPAAGTELAVLFWDGV